MKRIEYGDVCQHGHLITSDNVQLIIGRGLRCKTCQNEAVKKYYKKNRERILQKMKNKWQSDEKLHVQSRERKKQEYARNPDKLKERRKVWRKNNLETVKAYHSRPEMRIHNNISRAIRKALTQRKNGRKWEDIVGYSLNELVNHLQSGFKDGMGFHNYGEWEIDHIKPRSSFDFSKEDAVVECWKLQNLQPLWMSENRSKWANL